MSYEPTVWATGDVITSTKLNKLENGLAEASGGGTGGGVLVVNLTYEDTGTADKFTCDQKALTILTALKSGAVQFVCEEINTVFGCLIGWQRSNEYVFITLDPTGTEFISFLSTGDDYPEAVVPYK